VVAKTLDFHSNSISHRAHKCGETVRAFADDIGNE